jgi:Predicted membrane protein
MGKKFILYGLIGWCAEVFWTGLGSLLKGDLMLTSFTFMWMFPIYGMAVLLEPIHDIIRNKPVFIRGGVYVILFFTIEFVTGNLLKLLLGACPWDYSKSPLSVCGVIRIDYIPVWFFAGLLFEKIHDKFTYLSKIINAGKIN